MSLAWAMTTQLNSITLPEVSYHCLPLIRTGAVLLLYLEVPTEAKPKRFPFRVPKSSSDLTSHNGVPAMAMADLVGKSDVIWQVISLLNITCETWAGLNETPDCNGD